MRMILAFLKAESGATSIEYAMIAGFISIAIVAGATAIGTKLNAKYYSPVANGLS